MCYSRIVCNKLLPSTSTSLGVTLPENVHRLRLEDAKPKGKGKGRGKKGRARLRARSPKRLPNLVGSLDRNHVGAVEGQDILKKDVLLAQVSCLRKTCMAFQDYCFCFFFFFGGGVNPKKNRGC